MNPSTAVTANASQTMVLNEKMMPVNAMPIKLMASHWPSRRRSPSFAMNKLAITKPTRAMLSSKPNMNSVDFKAWMVNGSRMALLNPKAMPMTAYAMNIDRRLSVVVMTLIPDLRF